MMKKNNMARHASALAGMFATVCCSMLWLSGGIAIFVLQGGSA